MLYLSGDDRACFTSCAETHALLEVNGSIEHVYVVDKYFLIPENLFEHLPVIRNILHEDMGADKNDTRAGRVMHLSQA